MDPGAVRFRAHAFDMSQRFMKVTAPDSDSVSPPGPYMLFILNRKGVPSVAKMIFIK